MKLINNGAAQVCRACLKVKPVSEFYRHKSKTGFCKFCKECGHPAHIATYRRNNTK